MNFVVHASDVDGSDIVVANDQEREALLVQAMDACGGYVLWYLNSLSRDHVLAEDLSQKLWVYVFEKFSPNDYGHIGFLKRKAYQLFLDDTRKRKVRSHVSFVEDPPEPVVRQIEPEPSNSIEEQDLFERFWERFESLNFSDVEKQIFWFSARYGYTMKEIGLKLDISHSTAHDRLKSVKSRCIAFLNSANHDA